MIIYNVALIVDRNPLVQNLNEQKSTEGKGLKKKGKASYDIS
jgi:hypothetical protein